MGAVSDSRSGRLALYLAVLGGLLLLLGPAAYRFEVVDLLPSLAGVALGVFICVVGLMAGVMSGASSRHSPAAAQRARIGALCSALLLAYPVWVIVQSRGTPAIHHITTDPDDPPQFEELPPLRGVRANPLDYPGEEVATMQREAYPDVVPLHLSTPPSDAFASALDAALELGWDVVVADGEAGRIEATERTLVFGPDFRFRCGTVPPGPVAAP